MIDLVVANSAQTAEQLTRVGVSPSSAELASKLLERYADGAPISAMPLSWA